MTDVYEEERHFPLVVRLMPQYRQNEEAIKNIQVATPTGAMVPLRDLCNISIRSGASYIYRENNERYIGVQDVFENILSIAGGGYPEHLHLGALRLDLSAQLLEHVDGVLDGIAARQLVGLAQHIAGL